eukprot:CCRYP_014319-RA/>CCRYP_014319-RA protein AED:0.76 eAED:1.00 QI:0/0/0/0.5/0/0/2/0/112
MKANVIALTIVSASPASFPITTRFVGFAFRSARNSSMPLITSSVIRVKPSPRFVSIGGDICGPIASLPATPTFIGCWSWTTDGGSTTSLLAASMTSPSKAVSGINPKTITSG